MDLQERLYTVIGIKQAKEWQISTSKAGALVAKEVVHLNVTPWTGNGIFPRLNNQNKSFAWRINNFKNIKKGSFKVNTIHFTLQIP